MHTSIKLNRPCEFVNITPVNPLISKCQIKVCYVGDKPNRNHSIITKETATQMANSLPGSPIVGFYNDSKQDFEEHNRVIDISNGKFDIKDTTRPYGFVDLNAKVWFQWFLDDDGVEREYLVTEGYLWTEAYPECQRVIDKGNNQSMELSEKFLDANWTKDSKGNPEFFIINEAVVEKLCILGEDVEPCFEGSSITSFNLSFDDNFKQQLFSMMNDLKELLQEGGAKQMFTTYAVEIGDNLWSAIYQYIEETYPDPKCEWCSIYRIDGIFEEDGQKFAILQDRSNLKYYRINFAISEQEGFIPSADLVEVTKSYTPAAEPQFKAEDVEAFEATYAAKKKNEKEKDKTNQDDSDKTKDSTEGEKSEDEEKPADKTSDEEEKPTDGKEDNSDEEDKKKKKFSLEDYPEYVELTSKYSELETKYNALVAEKESLEEQLAPLTEFKKNAERKDKEAMINSFYMLSDEDKADVIKNIDTYSLDDIEAKLSIICVRNRVSFDLDKDEANNQPITFNLDGDDGSAGGDSTIPDWIKAIDATIADR